MIHSVGPEEASRAPAAIATACIESGADAVLLEEAALPAGFVDLGTGLLGELLHKLGMYGIPLAGVVTDPSRQPLRFQEFLRETNEGSQCRFFPSREAAVEWLESLERG